MRVVIKRPVDKSLEKAYKNLRKCYYEITDEILGDDYYTLSCDVYNSDKECCIDIITVVQRIKSNLKLSIFLNVVFIIMIVFFII